MGVPWLGWTDGTCPYCTSGRENLCLAARFTGRDRDGGYAELAVADARFCFPIPDDYPDLQAAPLLCSGLIGYRALRLAGDGERLGLWGFGAAAHIICQVAVHQGRTVFAFTRPATRRRRSSPGGWARRGRAVRTRRRRTSSTPPDLRSGRAPGPGRPARHRARRRRGLRGHPHERHPELSYELLWERARRAQRGQPDPDDGHEFLDVAPRVPVRTEVTEYPLERANDALEDLRAGRFRGAAVVVPDMSTSGMGTSSDPLP